MHQVRAIYPKPGECNVAGHAVPPRAHRNAQAPEGDTPMMAATAFKTSSNAITAAGRRDRQRLSRARAWVAADRARADLLGLNALCDPGWTLLLPLYVAEAEGRTCSVAAACATIALPETSALRWLHALAAEGAVNADHEYARRAGCALARDVRTAGRADGPGTGPAR